MKGRKIAAAIASAILALFACFGASVAEVLLFSFAQSSPPYGLDVVSLWKQSLSGKLAIVAYAAGALAVPVLSLVLTLLYTYRGFTRQYWQPKGAKA